MQVPGGYRLEGFGRAGDRWGLATALPLRALLRQYDGDLDGAFADLTEAKRLAREFGSLSLADEIFIDLRWIELHVRVGDTGRAAELIAATRDRARRSSSPELAILHDALEAGLWVRLGAPDRARELVVSAEARLAELPPGGGHEQALLASARAAVSIAEADATGAGKALEQAYAAALGSRDMPILAAVGVTTAALADLRGRHRDVAELLGAAARLRGAHDRTDPQIRQLNDRARHALGDEPFADAYEIGWKLDQTAARRRLGPDGSAAVPIAAIGDAAGHRADEQAGQSAEEGGADSRVDGLGAARAQPAP